MNPELRQILIDITTILLLALLPFLLYAAKRVGRRCVDAAAAIMGVSVDEAARKRLDWALEQGALYAEEWARKHLTANTATGAAKLETALHTARALDPKTTSQWTDDALVKLLEARVAKLRPSLSVPPPASAVDTGATWPRLPAVEPRK